MEKLQTKINIKQYNFILSKETVFSGIGSCFSQNILLKLYNYDFTTSYNPCGIVYNSYSILQSLQKVCSETLFLEKDFFQFNNAWHSWEHHGSFSDKILNNALEKANIKLISFRNNLKKSDYIIITLSSSVVYKLIKTQQIVANCHKVPNNKFKQDLCKKEIKNL